MRRINKLTQTSAMSIDALAKSLPNVSNLSAGDPNLDLQESIVNSYKNINIQQTHNYCGSQGILELRSKIYQDPSKVIIANGAKELIYIALMSVAKPRNHVVIIGPCWSSYVKICQILNLDYELIIGSEDRNYIPSIEMIEAAVTDKTTAILFNNPNNPTGIVYNRGYCEILVQIAQKHDCYIISDEIYSGLVYEGEHYSLLDKPNVIYINGFSKSYGLTGWRLGYAIADKTVIETMTAYQSQISGPPNTLVQKLVLDCFDSLQINKEEYKNRIETLAKSDEYFERFKPKAGFYFYIPIGNQWKSSSDLCEHMLEAYKIAITPGDDYGVPRTVRLSIANIDTEKLKEIAYLLKVIK